ncbi:hypothetical protein [Runella sp.]|uniref:hypothetical protein n=1 Tax=Runella sp. TaxID=1960881 RepID=UPI003D096899
MKRITFSVIYLLLAGWILFDVYYPQKHDLREFDPKGVALLDAAMWRSYYEKKPLKLFWQSAELLRQQVKAPFWRSFRLSYHAAKAAFVFKDGKNRRDYDRALPDLEAFYGGINTLSDRSFDVNKTARRELEWWIIRRYREQHPPEEWAELQAEIAAEIYHVPVEKCREYGRIRTEAMFFRDQKGDTITEADWQHVNDLLMTSWRSLAKANQ